MQNSTDYSDTAVTELVNEADDIAETALAAARKALAQYGDPRLADTYATAALRGIGGYFNPAIDRFKFTKDGDGTVPTELSAAAGLAAWAGDAASAAGPLRFRITKGTASLNPVNRERHEGQVRALAAHLENARKALTAYQAAVQS